MNDTCSVLEKALAVLRERGWCQGDYEDEDGAVCAIGGAA